MPSKVHPLGLTGPPKPPAGIDEVCKHLEVSAPTWHRRCPVRREDPAGQAPARSGILRGKVAAHMVVASVPGVGTLVVSVIALNVDKVIRDHSAHVRIPWGEVAMGLLATVLVALLFTTVGVLVALRASAALTAQRVLGMSLAGVVLLVSLGGSALPKRWHTDLSDLADDLGSLNTAVLVRAGTAVFAVVNAVLLVAAQRRFVRAELTRR